MRRAGHVGSNRGDSFYDREPNWSSRFGYSVDRKLQVIHSVRRYLPRLLALLGVIACLGGRSSAAPLPIDVGLLSYDAVSGSQDQFDITSLTGVDAFPSAFPITTTLKFTVTSLVVSFTTGSPLTLPGSDFTVVDPQGDVDCTAAACN